MRRIDGQIWIDNKDPHRLKYHYEGIDYVVEVSATYSPGFDESGIGITIPAGTVVKLHKGSIIAPAIFPDDINGVIGVTINKSTGGASQDNVAAIAQTGYIVLDEQNFNDSFALTSDKYVGENGGINNRWGDTIIDFSKTYKGIGAPIYWFIGGTFKEGKQYNYIDSSDKGYQGKLTFRTPSGYKWNVKDVEDGSMNIGYDNLPIIGTVAGYEYDENYKITKLFIHLNFSKFDSSVEWNWPYLHSPSSTKDPHTPSQDCGILKEGIHNFYHGLFAKNKYYSELSSYTNVMACSNTTTGSDQVINALTTNYISEDAEGGKRTTIELSTPEELIYRISGEVHYKFDKEEN